MRDGGVVRVASGAFVRRRSVRYGAVFVTILGVVVGGSLVASASRSPKGSTSGPAGSIGLTGHVISMSMSGVQGVGVTGGPGNLEVISFTWGIAGPKACAACGRAGRPTFSEIVVTKTVDSASPTLSRDCAQGRLIKSVVLYVTPAGSSSGSQDSMTMTFTDVIITEDHWNVVTAGNEMPTESLSLRYRSYVITYNAMAAATTSTTTTSTTTTTTTTTTVPPVTYVPTPTTSPIAALRVSLG